MTINNLSQKEIKTLPIEITQSKLLPLLKQLFPRPVTTNLDGNTDCRLSQYAKSAPIDYKINANICKDSAKLLGHFLGDGFIRGTDHEGAYLYDVADLLIQLLNTIGMPEPLHKQALLDAVQQLSSHSKALQACRLAFFLLPTGKKNPWNVNEYELGEAHEKIVEEQAFNDAQAIEKLDKGKTIYLSGGYSKHAMIYSFTRVDNDYLDIAIYDTGGKQEALAFLQDDSKERVLGVTRFKKVPQKEIIYDKPMPKGAWLAELLRPMIDLKLSVDNSFILDEVFSHLLKYREVPSQKPSDYISSQFSGTCSLKSVNRLIRELIPNKEHYKNLIQHVKYAALQHAFAHYCTLSPDQEETMELRRLLRGSVQKYVWYLSKLPYSEERATPLAGAAIQILKKIKNDEVQWTEHKQQIEQTSYFQKTEKKETVVEEWVCGEEPEEIIKALQQAHNTLEMLLKKDPRTALEYLNKHGDNLWKSAKLFRKKKIDAPTTHSEGYNPEECNRGYNIVHQIYDLVSEYHKTTANVDDEEWRQKWARGAYHGPFNEMDFKKNCRVTRSALIEVEWKAPTAEDFYIELLKANNNFEKLLESKRQAALFYFESIANTFPIDLASNYWKQVKKPEECLQQLLSMLKKFAYHTIDIGIVTTSADNAVGATVIAAYQLAVEVDKKKFPKVMNPLGDYGISLFNKSISRWDYQSFTSREEWLKWRGINNVFNAKKERLFTCIQIPLDTIDRNIESQIYTERLTQLPPGSVSILSDSRDAYKAQPTPRQHSLLTLIAQTKACSNTENISHIFALKSIDLIATRYFDCYNSMNIEHPQISCENEPWKINTVNLKLPSGGWHQKEEAYRTLHFNKKQEKPSWDVRPQKKEGDLSSHLGSKKRSESYILDYDLPFIKEVLRPTQSLLITPYQILDVFARKPELLKDPQAQSVFHICLFSAYDPLHPAYDETITHQQPLSNLLKQFIESGMDAHWRKCPEGRPDVLTCIFYLELNAFYNNLTGENYNIETCVEEWLQDPRTTDIEKGRIHLYKVFSLMNSSSQLDDKRLIDTFVSWVSYSHLCLDEKLPPNRVLMEAKRVIYRLLATHGDLLRKCASSIGEGILNCLGHKHASGTWEFQPYPHLVMGNWTISLDSRDLECKEGIFERGEIPSFSECTQYKRLFGKREQKLHHCGRSLEFTDPLLGDMRIALGGTRWIEDATWELEIDQKNSLEELFRFGLQKQISMAWCFYAPLYQLRQSAIPQGLKEGYAHFADIEKKELYFVEIKTGQIRYHMTKDGKIHPYNQEKGESDRSISMASCVEAGIPGLASFEDANYILVESKDEGNGAVPIKIQLIRFKSPDGQPLILERNSKGDYCWIGDRNYVLAKSPFSHVAGTFTGAICLIHKEQGKKKVLLPIHKRDMSKKLFVEAPLSFPSIREELGLKKVGDYKDNSIDVGRNRQAVAIHGHEVTQSFCFVDCNLNRENEPLPSSVESKLLLCYLAYTEGDFVQAQSYLKGIPSKSKLSLPSRQILENILEYRSRDSAEACAVRLLAAVRLGNTSHTDSDASRYFSKRSTINKSVLLSDDDEAVVALKKKIPAIVYLKSGNEHVNRQSVYTCRSNNILIQNLNNPKTKQQALPIARIILNSPDMSRRLSFDGNQALYQAYSWAGGGVYGLFERRFIENSLDTIILHKATLPENPPPPLPSPSLTFKSSYSLDLTHLVGQYVKANEKPKENRADLSKWQPDKKGSYDEVIQHELKELQNSYQVGAKVLEERPIYSIENTQNLVKTLKEEEETLRREVITLQEELLKLANVAADDSKERLKEDLHTIAGVSKILTMEGLRHLFVKRNPALYIEANPHLAHENRILTLYQLYGKYLERSNAHNRTKRMLSTLENIARTPLHTHRLLEMLYHDASPSTYSIAEYPSFAVLENVENVSLFPDQVTDLKALLNNEIAVLQAMMGKGKTTKYAPLWLFEQAKMGILACLVVPSPYFTSTRTRLSEKQYELFGQEIDDIEDIFASDAEGVRTINITKIKEAKKRIQWVIAHQGALVIDHATLRSLETAFMRMYHHTTENITLNLEEHLKELAELLQIFRKKGVALLDEVDLVLSSTFEVNSPAGLSEKIPQHYRDLIRELFKIMTSDTIKVNELSLKEHTQLLFNKQKEIGVDFFIHQLSPVIWEKLALYYAPLYSKEYAEQFRRYVTRQIDRELDTWIKKLSLNKLLEKPNTYLEWLKEVQKQLPPDSAMKRDLAFLIDLEDWSHRDNNDPLKKSSDNYALARYLNDLLVHTLAAEGNRRYGRHGKGVVPFKGANKPDTTQFGNTMQHGLYHGQMALHGKSAHGFIEKWQIEELIQQFSEAANHFIDCANETFTETEEAKEFKELTNCDLRFMDQKGMIEKALEHVNSNHIRRVTVELYTAKDILQYPVWYSSTNQTFYEQFSSSQGMSGTVDNAAEFPLPLAGKCKTDHLIEGQIVAATLKNKLVKASTTNPEICLLDLLTQFDGTPRGLADAGALLKDHSPLEVARGFLKALRDKKHDCQAVLFFQPKEGELFSSGSHLYALTEVGERPLFVDNTSKKAIKRAGLDFTKCFYYLDEVNTACIDLPAIPNSFNFATCDGSMPLRAYLQAIPRFRDCCHGQQVHLVMAKDEKRLPNNMVGIFQHAAINQAILKLKRREATYRSKLNTVYQSYLVDQILTKTVQSNGGKELFKKAQPFIAHKHIYSSYEAMGRLELSRNTMGYLKEYAASLEERFKKTFGEVPQQIQTKVDEIVKAAQNDPHLLIETKQGVTENTSEMNIELNRERELEQNIETEVKHLSELEKDLERELETYSLIGTGSSSDKEETDWSEIEVARVIDELAKEEKITDPRIMSLEHVLQQVKYEKPYYKIATHRVFGTKNWAETRTDGILPIFHKLQKPLNQILAVKTQNGFKALLLSAHDAEEFKKHLRSLYKNSRCLEAYLITPFGNLMERHPDPKCPSWDELKQILVEINVFNGNASVLKAHKQDYIDWVKERNIDLTERFLQLKTYNDSKERQALSQALLKGAWNVLASFMCQKRVMKEMETFFDFAEYTKEQIQQLPPALLRFVAPHQIKFLNKEQVEALPINRLGHLVGEQWDWLTRSQIMNIQDPQQIQQLNPVQISMCTPGQLKHLSETQVKQITDATYITPETAQWVENEKVIQAITDTSCIQKLNVDHIAKFTIKQLDQLSNLITDKQASLLTNRQITLLTNPTLIKKVSADKLELLAPELKHHVTWSQSKEIYLKERKNTILLVIGFIALSVISAYALYIHRTQISLFLSRIRYRLSKQNILKLISAKNKDE